MKKFIAFFTITAILIVFALTMSTIQKNEVKVVAQSQEIALHYFEVQTNLQCLQSQTSEIIGVVSYDVSAEINSKGAPVDANISVVYRDHNSDGTHGPRIERIIAHHTHEPSRSVDFTKLHTLFSTPPHHNTDHQEPIVFIVHGMDSIGQNFKYEYTLNVPTCITPKSSSNIT